MRLHRTLSLIALSLGCGTPSSVTRPDLTPVGTIIVRQRSLPPVQVSQAEFETVMARLALDVRRLSPLATQQWHFAGWEPGCEQADIQRGYRCWCERKRGSPGDCLLLGNSFGADQKRSLALTLALESGSVWAGASNAVKGMMDPLVLQATIATAMAAYMGLLLLPEPITKVIAVALTVYMVSYLGLDTFWNLIQGWKQFTAQVNTARTFEELSEAGQGFGRILGANSARVFVMLVTAALGQTAGLAANGPSLPASAQAAWMAEAQGLRLSALSQISSVTLAADGTLTAALAPGAMAMATSSMPRGESREQPSGDQKANPASDNLTARPEVVLSGGRSGEEVKRLIGPPNSVVRGGCERAFVTNTKGEVILDITKDRVKPVTPGRGFGPKRAPSSEELNLLEAVLRGDK